MAQHLGERHDLPPERRHLILTPDAMAALNVLFRAVRGAGGGEVIVITPCWMDYPLYLTNLGLRPVLVPVDPRSLRLDLGRIRAALGPATGAVVLSQPANPTGIVYAREELRALAALLAAAEPRPLLISDECHRDFLFAPERFSSPLEHYDETCLVYSFGKGLFMQGQRIGYIAVSPRMAASLDRVRTLERLCRTRGFCTPDALMQIAIRRLIGQPPALPSPAVRRRRALSALREAGYAVVPSEGTLFLYPRSPDPDDFALVERLARRGLAMPSSLFHRTGYFRISPTALDAMIDAALPTLRELQAAEVGP